MNLLYIAPFGLGQKTTVWARTLPLARELVARGHHARIVIPPWDTPKDAGRSWNEDGVELINVTLGGGIPMVVRRMLAEVQRADPDLIHIVKPRAHAGLVQWWLWRQSLWRRGKRPPLLLDMDDWEQAWAEINDYGQVTARFLAWQEEWGIRHADGITVASRWLEDRARSYAPAMPVLYLPNGVTTDEILPASAENIPDTLVILFFSRFVEVEPAWLADCWQRLCKALPGARLVVAGRALTPGRETLFQEAMKARAPEAASAVEWRGFVERKELDALYREATCAIFPADPIPLQQAKCSVRLATTLLHGVPVVASAVGEQANYGADGAAKLVPPNATPRELAETVADFIMTSALDPVQRRRIVERARQRLQREYNWPGLAVRAEQFYRQMIRDE